MNFVGKIFLLSFLISTVKSASFTVTSQVYLDIRHNKEDFGRMVIGLFGKIAPKTVENFRQICTKGIDGRTYKGTKFHRVVDRFIIQAGDIVSNNGLGSISIYGKYFDDENVTTEHTSAGFVGMANRGPNTNGCQFYITTMKAPWLNGKHTIFGKVIKNQGVVHKIEKVKTDTDDIPLKPVVITRCGEIPTPEPFEESDELYSIWAWVVATGPPLGMSFTILAIFHYFIRKLNMFC